MKRLLSLLLSCALGLSLLSGCSSREGCGPLIEERGPTCEGFFAPPPSEPWPYAENLSVNPHESEAVNEALASFGLNLLQKSREADEKSTLISPLSVALALSMTANGADGITLAQFQNLLGADLVELNAACAQFMYDYQGLRGSSQCRIANSLWTDFDGSIYEKFVTQCRGYYSAQVYEANLSDERIVDDINQWVSEKTNKLIPKIIDQPFDESTACLLVNALYLKNSWLREFDPLCTHEMDFHHTDGSTSQADYLQHFDAKLSYVNDKGAQGVVLPYDDGRLAFFAMMPDLYPDFPDLGEWLNSLDGGLSWLIANREDAFFLRFAMPKFETEWNGDLADALSALGLEDAFLPGKANFFHMVSKPADYYLSQVVHAAKIEVNEKGTEAAAATIAAPAAGEPMPDPDGITLILDRPFLYGIIDLDTGVPLFLGTYE